MRISNVIDTFDAFAGWSIRTVSKNLVSHGGAYFETGSSCKLSLADWKLQLGVSMHT